MLKYKDYTNEEMDACDISEEQKRYLFALGLTQACMQIGR